MSGLRKNASIFEQHARDRLVARVEVWSASHPNPTRRDLAKLTTWLRETERADLQILTEHFDDRASYPERPMVLLSPPGAPSVWLLGWRKGDWTPIHDHVHSEAAITVLGREVTERVFWPQTEQAQFPESGPEKEIDRELHEGSTVTVPTPYVHAVGNDQDQSAVTLHAYYPPLKSMDYYEVKDGRLVPAGRWDDDTP